MFVLCVMPFILGQVLPVEIQVDETKIIVNEPIVVEIVVKNPYPLPVWYFGCEWISLEVYPSDVPRPENESYAVSAVAGGKLGSGARASVERSPLWWTGRLWKDDS